MAKKFLHDTDFAGNKAFGFPATIPWENSWDYFVYWECSESADPPLQPIVGDPGPGFAKMSISNRGPEVHLVSRTVGKDNIGVGWAPGPPPPGSPDMPPVYTASSDPDNPTVITLTVNNMTGLVRDDAAAYSIDPILDGTGFREMEPIDPLQVGSLVCLETYWGNEWDWVLYGDFRVQSITRSGSLTTFELVPIPSHLGETDSMGQEGTLNMAFPDPGGGQPWPLAEVDLYVLTPAKMPNHFRVLGEGRDGSVYLGPNRYGVIPVVQPHGFVSDYNQAEYHVGWLNPEDATNDAGYLAEYVDPGTGLSALYVNTYGGVGDPPGAPYLAWQDGLVASRDWRILDGVSLAHMAGRGERADFSMNSLLGGPSRFSQGSKVRGKAQRVTPKVLSQVKDLSSTPPFLDFEWVVTDRYLSDVKSSLHSVGESHGIFAVNMLDSVDRWENAHSVPLILPPVSRAMPGSVLTLTEDKVPTWSSPHTGDTDVQVVSLVGQGPFFCELEAGAEYTWEVSQAPRVHGTNPPYRGTLRLITPVFDTHLKHIRTFSEEGGGPTSIPTVIGTDYLVRVTPAASPLFLRKPWQPGSSSSGVVINGLEWRFGQSRGIGEHVFTARSATSTFSGMFFDDTIDVFEIVAKDSDGNVPPLEVAFGSSFHAPSTRPMVEFEPDPGVTTSYYSYITFKKKSAKAIELLPLVQEADWRGPFSFRVSMTALQGPGSIRVTGTTANGKCTSISQIIIAPPQTGVRHFLVGLNDRTRLVIGPAPAGSGAEFEVEVASAYADSANNAVLVIATPNVVDLPLAGNPQWVIYAGAHETPEDSVPTLVNREVRWVPGIPSTDTALQWTLVQGDPTAPGTFTAKSGTNSIGTVYKWGTLWFNPIDANGVDRTAELMALGTAKELHLKSEPARKAAYTVLTTDFSIPPKVENGHIVVELNWKSLPEPEPPMLPEGLVTIRGISQIPDGMALVLKNGRPAWASSASGGGNYLPLTGGDVTAGTNRLRINSGQVSMDANNEESFIGLVDQSGDGTYIPTIAGPLIWIGGESGAVVNLAAITMFDDNTLQPDIEQLLPDEQLAVVATRGWVSDRIWKGTQAQYDAIATKDPAVLYVVVP